MFKKISSIFRKKSELTELAERLLLLVKEKFQRLTSDGVILLTSNRQYLYRNGCDLKDPEKFYKWVFAVLNVNDKKNNKLARNGMVSILRSIVGKKSNLSFSDYVKIVGDLEIDFCVMIEASKVKTEGTRHILKISESTENVNELLLNELAELAGIDACSALEQIGEETGKNLRIDQLTTKDWGLLLDVFGVNEITVQFFHTKNVSAKNVVETSCVNLPVQKNKAFTQLLLDINNWPATDESEAIRKFLEKNDVVLIDRCQAMFLFLTRCGVLHYINMCDNDFFRSFFEVNAQVTQVKIPHSVYKVVDVACGHKHALFLTSNGKVFGIGGGKKDPLGVGNKDVHVKTLVPISILDKVTVIKIDAAKEYSLMLDHKGCVFKSGGADQIYGVWRIKQLKEKIISMKAHDNIAIFLSAGGGIFVQQNKYYVNINEVSPCPPIKSIFYGSDLFALVTRRGEVLVGNSDRLNNLNKGESLFELNLEALEDSVAVVCPINIGCVVVTNSGNVSVFSRIGGRLNNEDNQQLVKLSKMKIEIPRETRPLQNKLFKQQKQVTEYVDVRIVTFFGNDLLCDCETPESNQNEDETYCNMKC